MRCGSTRDLCELTCDWKLFCLDKKEDPRLRGRALSCRGNGLLSRRSRLWMPLWWPGSKWCRSLSWTPPRLSTCSRERCWIGTHSRNCLSGLHNSAKKQWLDWLPQEGFDRLSTLDNNIPDDPTTMQLEFRLSCGSGCALRFLKTSWKVPNAPSSKAYLLWLSNKIFSHSILSPYRSVFYL